MSNFNTSLWETSNLQTITVCVRETLCVHMRVQVCTEAYHEYAHKNKSLGFFMVGSPCSLGCAGYWWGELGCFNKCKEVHTKPDKRRDWEPYMSCRPAFLAGWWTDCSWIFFNSGLCSGGWIQEAGIGGGGGGDQQGFPWYLLCQDSNKAKQVLRTTVFLCLGPDAQFAATPLGLRTPREHGSDGQKLSSYLQLQPLSTHHSLMGPENTRSAMFGSPSAKPLRLRA